MRKAPQLLVELVESSEFSPDVVRRVKVYPATWARWIADDAETEGLTWFDTSIREATVERADLLNLAATIEDDDPTTLRRLFVATMMWGTGQSNGRGPRYLSLALADSRLDETLHHTRQAVLDNRPEDAYSQFKIDGVGPSFFTKWFWAAGLGSDLRVVPLVLDARVWASLGALGWNSVTAAESRLRKLRYRAYLDVCAEWAAGNPELFSSPEDVENVLFRWAGK